MEANPVRSPSGACITGTETQDVEIVVVPDHGQLRGPDGRFENARGRVLVAHQADPACSSTLLLAIAIIHHRFLHVLRVELHALGELWTPSLD